VTAGTGACFIQSAPYPAQAWVLASGIFADAYRRANRGADNSRLL
jgi:hypothetical protein